MTVDNGKGICPDNTPIQIRCDTMEWNLKEKPERCQDTEDGEICTNKAYSINRLTPNMFYWVCRKHHDRYNLGKW